MWPNTQQRVGGAYWACARGTITVNTDYDTCIRNYEFGTFELHVILKIY